MDKIKEQNVNNLFVVTRYLSKDVTTLSAESLNYTRIIETNNEDFIDYVKGNISIVLQELRNINKDDSSDSLLYILNLKDIDSEIKKQYLPILAFAHLLHIENSNTNLSSCHFRIKNTEKSIKK